MEPYNLESPPMTSRTPRVRRKALVPLLLSTASLLPALSTAPAFGQPVPIGAQCVQCETTKEKLRSVRGKLLAFDATLPCSLPYAWLKTIVGGAAGISSLLQNEDTGEATLASIVSFVGFGVVTDAISFVDFRKEYRKALSEAQTLRRNVSATIQRFREVRETLAGERCDLEASLLAADCIDSISPIADPSEF